MQCPLLHWIHVDFFYFIIFLFFYVFGIPKTAPIKHPRVIARECFRWAGPDPIFLKPRGPQPHHSLPALLGFRREWSIGTAWWWSRKIMDPVGPMGQPTWRAGRMPVLFTLPRNANISLTLLSVPQPHSPTKQCITVAKFLLLDALFNYVYPKPSAWQNTGQELTQTLQVKAKLCNPFIP